jgi:hypothetical protein
MGEYLRVFEQPKMTVLAPKCRNDGSCVGIISRHSSGRIVVYSVYCGHRMSLDMSNPFCNRYNGGHHCAPCNTTMHCQCVHVSCTSVE